MQGAGYPGQAGGYQEGQPMLQGQLGGQPIRKFSQTWKVIFFRCYKMGFFPTKPDKLKR